MQKKQKTKTIYLVILQQKKDIKIANLNEEIKKIDDFNKDNVSKKEKEHENMIEQIQKTVKKSKNI